MWGNARGSGLVVGLALAVGLGSAGCDLPVSVQAEIVCTTVCRCFAPGGVLDQEECVTDCVGNIGPISEACFSCVNTFANQCTELVDECDGVCGQNRALELEGGGTR